MWVTAHQLDLVAPYEVVTPGLESTVGEAGK